MPVYDEGELSAYYTRLGMAQPMVDRVKSLIGEYISFIGRAPEFIFIENTVNAEGIHDFPNIVLLTKDTYGEFSIPASQNICSFLPLKTAWCIMMPQRHEITFGSALPEGARLTVQVFFSQTAPAYFNATGQNCAELLTATRQYFMASMCE
jgi:hypothetical protein